MGNVVVERASLPRNYVPIGIKEYDGIVYVVAYNPLEQRVQFGSFPSPEIDFDGSDFDSEDYQLEGVVFQTEDFYKSTIELETPNVTDPPLIDSYFNEQIAELENGSQQTESITNLNTWHDNNSNQLKDAQDHWTINTLNGKPKFTINKSECLETFESYEWLRLNSGDRFVIYYIDNTAEQGYSGVEEILKHYVSTAESRKLFKVEVFQIGKSGRRPLTINPLLYSKDDIDINILNGSLVENVEYEVFDGEVNSILEIKISLEKPSSFKAQFKQRRTQLPTKVRFKTYSSCYSFMQIKGFLYEIKGKKINGDPIPTLKGYMRYTQQALYQDLNQKTSISSTVEIEALDYGTYSYTITPFTQYGYEPSLIQSGTFEVSESNVIEDTEIILSKYNWNRSGNNFTFELEADYLLGTDEIVEDQYMEFYDVWSNLSTIINIAVPAENITYTNTFALTNYNKSNTFNTSNFGGIPLQATTLITPKVLLQNPNLEYQIDNVCTNNLSPNRFYVFVLTYVVQDTSTLESRKIRLHRYLYTNDVFNSSVEDDFSNLTYTPVDISLTKQQEETQTPFEPYIDFIGVNTNSYLVDPLLQVGKETFEKTHYAILPKYFHDKYYNAKNLQNTYSKRIYFLVRSEINHNVALANHPGYINDNIVAGSWTNSPLTLINNRSTTSFGGSTVSDNDVLKSIDVPILKNRVVYLVNDDCFSIQAYTDVFKVHQNVCYDYSEQNMSLTTHTQPLLYTSSDEVQDKFMDSVNNNNNSFQLLDSSLTLEFSGEQSYHINQTFPATLKIRNSTLIYGINANNYNSNPQHTHPKNFGYLSSTSFYKLNDPQCMFNNPIFYPWEQSIPPTIKTEFDNIYTKQFRNENRTQNGLLEIVTYSSILGRILRTTLMFPVHALVGGQYVDGFMGVGFEWLYNNPQEFNMFNLLIGMGGSTTLTSEIPANQKYKIYAPNAQIRKEESSSSNITYTANSQWRYNIYDTYCYKIYAPGITESVQTRIVLNLSQIENYVSLRTQYNYDNQDFLPIQIPKSNEQFTLNINPTITIGGPIDIDVPEEIGNQSTLLLQHPLITNVNFQSVDSWGMYVDTRNTNNFKSKLIDMIHELYLFYDHQNNIIKCTSVGAHPWTNPMTINGPTGPLTVGYIHPLYGNI